MPLTVSWWASKYGLLFHNIVPNRSSACPLAVCTADILHILSYKPGKLLFGHGNGVRFQPDRIGTIFFHILQIYQISAVGAVKIRPGLFGEFCQLSVIFDIAVYGVKQDLAVENFCVNNVREQYPCGETASFYENCARCSQAIFPVCVCYRVCQIVLGRCPFCRSLQVRFFRLPCILQQGVV